RWSPSYSEVSVVGRPLTISGCVATSLRRPTPSGWRPIRHSSGVTSPPERRRSQPGTLPIRNDTSATAYHVGRPPPWRTSRLTSGSGPSVPVDGCGGVEDTCAIPAICAAWDILPRPSLRVATLVPIRHDSWFFLKRETQQLSNPAAAKSP